MKTTLTLAMLFGLGSLPLFAGEAGDIDPERSLVKDGVLGAINVLRGLDHAAAWSPRKGSVHVGCGQRP